MKEDTDPYKDPDFRGLYREGTFPSPRNGGENTQYSLRRISPHEQNPPRGGALDRILRLYRRSAVGAAALLTAATALTMFAHPNRSGQESSHSHALPSATAEPFPRTSTPPVTAEPGTPAPINNTPSVPGEPSPSGSDRSSASPPDISKLQFNDLAGSENNVFMGGVDNAIDFLGRYIVANPDALHPSVTDAEIGDLIRINNKGRRIPVGLEARAFLSNAVGNTNKPDVMLELDDMNGQLEADFSFYLNGSGKMISAAQAAVNSPIPPSELKKLFRDNGTEWKPESDGAIVRNIIFTMPDGRKVIAMERANPDGRVDIWDTSKKITSSPQSQPVGS